MKPLDFYNTFKNDALVSERETGVSHLFTLAEAALESGWGKAAPGNMFFGVKDTDGVNGNEQLLTTTEILRTSNAKFPVIISIVPVVRNGLKYFKYTVKDYFRKYATPADCFRDHNKFFFANPRYKFALQAKGDPYVFAKRVAAAGYATDPDYYQKLTSIINTLKKFE